MPETIGKKKLGHWPVVFADYQDALTGKIKPSPKEVFLDYQGKDALFYDPSGKYVSIVSLIRAGVIQTWMPPCVSLDAIIAKYPDPPLSTVCTATDTGIIYEYRGNGNWIPISINAIQLASSKNDGLMASTEYDKLQECYNRTHTIYFGPNEAIPLPKDRKSNAIYGMCTGIIAEKGERDYVQLNPVEEKVVREDWPYTQLWDVDPETGEMFEVIDPLYLAVRSEDQVVPVETPEGYSDVRYMVPKSIIIEELTEVEFTYNAYPEGWPYDKLIEVDSEGKTYAITDPGYKTVSNESEVVQVDPEEGVSTVYYNVPKEADDVRNETQNKTDDTM